MKAYQINGKKYSTLDNVLIHKGIDVYPIQVSIWYWFKLKLMGR